MAIQLSVAVRNARLDAIETAIGATAKLQIRTGAQPANCAAANSGTLLMEMTLPADYMAAASSGSKAKSGTWSGTASATGNAGHFRKFANDGTTCHEQGSVTELGGGGDMELQQATVGIVNGQGVTVSTYTLTDANS